MYDDLVDDDDKYPPREETHKYIDARQKRIAAYFGLIAGAMAPKGDTFLIGAGATIAAAILVSCYVVFGDGSQRALYRKFVMLDAFLRVMKFCFWGYLFYLLSVETYHGYKVLEPFFLKDKLTVVIVNATLLSLALSLFADGIAKTDRILKLAFYVRRLSRIMAASLVGYFGAVVFLAGGNGIFIFWFLFGFIILKFLQNPNYLRIPSHCGH